MSATEPRDALESAVVSVTVVFEGTHLLAYMAPEELGALRERPRLLARPTANEEAIEAAAREISDRLFTAGMIQETERPKGIVRVVCRRHFGASDTGGEHGH